MEDLVLESEILLELLQLLLVSVLIHGLDPDANGTQQSLLGHHPLEQAS